MNKKLVINAATCDFRKVNEKTLEAYEKIVINAAVALTNERSRALLDRYPVHMNCDQVLDVDEDVQVSVINGSCQIKSTDIVTGKRVLVVNGSVEIGPDTEKVLEQYVGILVNGSVTCPESQSGALGMLKVNGSTNTYPDGALLLKRNAVIDRLFAPRAKEALYWARKRLVMVDPQLDPAALERKNVRFSSKEAIIAESKLEGMISLIDEKTDIIVVPDGTAVILDDVALEDVTVKKYGTKLYIVGDLTVDKEAENALSKLEYLKVQGDASVNSGLKELLLEHLQEISGNVKVLKGRSISDKISVRISKWMLEREKDGITVTDCVSVKLDRDVDKELILERLSISDCATVGCTPEQEDAVIAICQDVAQIGEAANGVGGMIKEAMGIDSEEDGLLGMAKGLLETKVINTTDYVM